MIKNIQKIKGEELETAIEFIEKTILKYKSSLKDKDYFIERNKIIIKNGVKYEIDIYVEFDISLGQKFIYIFECKNWKKPVPRKEITDFNDKINLLDANKGFFIANKFSRDALNKTEEFSRVECLTFDREEFPKFSSIPNFIFNERVSNILKVNFYFENESYNGIPLQLNLSTIYGGRFYLLNQFVNEIHKLQKFHDENKKIIKRRIDFVEKELLIDNKKVICADFYFNFKYAKLKPKTFVSYDVKKKGRFFKIILDSITGLEIRINTIIY